MAAVGTLFGYGIRSAFSHERLSPAPSRRGTIEIGRCGPVSIDAASVTHRDTSGGSSFTIGREPDGSLAIVCSAAGGFRFDAQGLAVLADGTRGAGEVWEHRLVSVVVPLLLAERGDIVLHAAAVARNGRAVAFIGPSTRGKSTLAVAAGAAGLEVLADDGVVIETTDGAPVVWPGPVGARLAVPGAPRKSTAVVGRTPMHPARLVAIAVLGPLADGASEVRPLAPVAAVPAFVPSLMFAGTDRLSDAMASAAWLAARIPAVRCRLPRGLDGLAAAVEAVVDELFTPDGE